MSTYETDFNIRYTEIDSNNRLSPIAVMQYLQEIGCLHSNSVGMGLYQRTGWVIIHWKVKIVQKPKWNERIHIKTWVPGIQGPYCIRNYEITSGGEQIAIATSRWVLTDPDTHKLMKITDEMLQSFGIEEKDVISEPFTKMKEPESYSKEIETEVALKDIDTNKHLNNIKYLELAYNTLGEDNNINYIEAIYKHSAILGETIKICCHKESEKIENVVIKNGDKLSCIVKFGKE